MDTTNFFGVQRFGESRPVTHVVGEAIARGDFREGLKMYPVRLQFERAMMNYLIAHPDDYTGAFRVLSPNLQKMFLHAYQSYIFNRILSRRILMGLSIHEAYSGDIVCFKNEMGLPDTSRLQKVTADNLDGINNLMKRGRAFVTAPLVGYDTNFAEGEQGEIEREVVKELNLDLEGFKVPAMPELSSKGLRKEIVLLFKPDFGIMDDEINVGKVKVTLEFSLPKGGYATTVLREYMKA